MGCTVYTAVFVTIVMASLPRTWAVVTATLLVVLAIVPYPKERPAIVSRVVKDCIACIEHWCAVRVIHDADAFKAVPGPYVIGLEPHSAIPAAIPSVFVAESTRLPAALQPCHGVATSAAFHVPLVRHIWWWLGVRPITRDWIAALLRGGASVCLNPGGIQECLLMAPEHEVAFLRRRLGFVRLALRHGAPLVPAFAFGQSNMYHYARPGPPLVPHAPLAWLSRRIGFVPMALWGVAGSMVPYDAPLTVALGRPIAVPTVPEPSVEQCQLYLDRFIAEMERIVAAHRADAGHPDLTLKVL